MATLAHLCRAEKAQRRSTQSLCRARSVGIFKKECGSYVGIMLVDFLIKTFLLWTAYRVSSAQIGTAIFIGVVCTSLNLWNLYRQQNSSGADCKSKLATVSRRSSSVASSKKTGSALPTGYDNASWVYGDEVDGVHLHPEPPARRVFMTTSSLEAPAVHLPAQMSTAAVRYATIRRAASILP